VPGRDSRRLCPRPPVRHWFEEGHSRGLVCALRAGGRGRARRVRRAAPGGAHSEGRAQSPTLPLGARQDARPLQTGCGRHSDAPGATLALAADQLNVSAVFAAGTDRGNEVMARLAARAGLPLATNCIAVTPGQPVEVTRLRWGGSLLEEARLHSPRPLITVAPHTVPADTGPAPAELDLKPSAESELVVRVSDHVAPSNGGVSLTTAKVIVSGGRGVGSKEGFAIIEELASLLGAAV